MKRVCLIIILIAFSSLSLAFEKITGKVTLIEPTYLPGKVQFTMDVGSVSCPVGNWLVWQKPETENNMAIYSMLMTAFVSGKDIKLYINDGDTSCMGQLINMR